VMTSQENSAATVGAGMRKSEDVSVQESNKKCARARMNATDVWVSIKWKEDNEKRTIKTETSASTANQDVNSTNANDEVMYDQEVMTSQENSAATVGVGMRKSEDVSVQESNKKCARARMNATDVWVSIKWKEDNEKRTIKTETSASTANQDVNSTSANEGVMYDQVMTSQENSAAAVGVGKRKSEDVSVLESNKKCTRARMDAIDVSRNDRSVSIKWTALSFEKRCGQLLAFKDEFGHYNVPTGYSAVSSLGLGQWCKDMRSSYEQIQEGKPSMSNLSQDRIEHLEKIGFKWKVVDSDKKFEKRCLDVETFKKKFGHCDVPGRYSADPSLGHWCSTMRYTYHLVQLGKPTPHNLSQDRIERLEEIGFKWKVVDFDKKFEKRCLDLEAFKKKFGHCDVPQQYSVDPSLGRWCSRMRYTYNQIQQGKPTKIKLSQDRIERLEKIGFKWKVVDSDKKFEKHCQDVETFKKKFGHCDVPGQYSADPSLGSWCSTMRHTYHLVQQGKPTQPNLSQDRIERLEEIGFKWKGVDFDKKFEKRCLDLEAFKKKFGHCDVPQQYSVDPSLGSWCSRMRYTYNQIQQGKPTKIKLSQDRIERLEEIGFKWKGVGFDKLFEKHCQDLEAFKRQFGHCDVPQRYSADPSLGSWCKATRRACHHIQQGMTTKSKLSQERIERLEEIGFKWEI